MPMSHLGKRQKAPRKLSLMEMCIRDHTDLEFLKGIITQDDPDIYEDGGDTKLSGYIPYPTDGSEPFDTSVCFIDKEAERLFTNTGTIVITDHDRAPGDDGYLRDRKARSYCPVPSAPASPPALCEYKNLNFQAKIKMRGLRFKNCAFDTCKTTKSTTVGKTLEAKGEIKFAAELFKVFNLEASLSLGLTNTYSYVLTEEQALSRGSIALEVGVTVEFDTSVDSISIAGKVNDVCTANVFETKQPIKNNYLINKLARNVWISCDHVIKKPAAPAAAPAAAKPDSKRDDQPAQGGAPAGDAPAGDASAGDVMAEYMDPTYDDYFGSEGEEPTFCFNYFSGAMMFDEDCI
ncbi:hypothetical protein BGZ88_003840 [Linnemannia elongata]|nr:hypothetical protein BGZ88_003840 [Linnemannia elongata]